MISRIKMTVTVFYKKPTVSNQNISRSHRLKKIQKQLGNKIEIIFISNRQIIHKREMLLYHPTVAASTEKLGKIQCERKSFSQTLQHSTD